MTAENIVGNLLQTNTAILEIQACFNWFWRYGWWSNKKQLLVKQCYDDIFVKNKAIINKLFSPEGKLFSECQTIREDVMPTLMKLKLQEELNPSKLLLTHWIKML